MSFEVDPRDTNGDGLLDARGGERRTVRLTGDRTQGRVDRFKRLLAYAVIAAKSLGLTQISAGWSDVYVYEKRFLQYGRFFTTAKNKTKAAGAGAWTLCGGEFHRPI